MSDPWRSCADWGDYDVFNGRNDNVTKDINGTKAAADAVCNRLKRDGFGGNRQVFPVRVWSEMVTEEDSNE